MALEMVELVGQERASVNLFECILDLPLHILLARDIPFSIGKGIILNGFDKCAKQFIRKEDSVEMLCAMQRRPNEPVHQQR
jgi:hypothetical protein